MNPGWRDANLALRDLNTIYLITNKQQNDEGNILRTDPSYNQGNFNRQFKKSLVFTPLTHPDAS